MAGCKPNPGWGYGSFEVSGLERRQRLSFGFGTSNTAEWRALLAALQVLKRFVPSGAQVLIFTDSELVRHQLDGSWRCLKPGLKACRDAAVVLLDGYEWTIEWQGRLNNVERFGH